MDNYKYKGISAGAYVEGVIEALSQEEANFKLKEMNFTEEQISTAKASRGKGCSKCKDSGYKGRMGIYEILSVSKPIKEAILRKATTPELKEIAMKEGFRTMQDMGRELILTGDLNFREFDRVLSME